MMKILLYSVLGFLGASAIAWGCLIAWGRIFLEHGDSYWDRTAYAADTFIGCWLLFAVLAAVTAGRLGRRRVK